MGGGVYKNIMQLSSLVASKDMVDLAIINFFEYACINPLVGFLFPLRLQLANTLVRFFKISS